MHPYYLHSPASDIHTIVDTNVLEFEVLYTNYQFVLGLCTTNEVFSGLLFFIYTYILFFGNKSRNTKK